MLLKIPIFSPKNIILCQSNLFNKVADPACIYLFKVTIQTLENGVKYVQSQQYKHQNDVIDHSVI